MVAHSALYIDLHIYTVFEDVSNQTVIATDTDCKCECHYGNHDNQCDSLRCRSYDNHSNNE